MDDRKKRTEIPDDKWWSHHQLLTKVELDQAAAVDKNLLALSSGAIGLSALFLFNFSGKAAFWTIAFLLSSWVSFVVTIIATLFSFITAQAGYRERRDEWDKMYKTRHYDPDCLEHNRHEVRTRRLNRFAIWSFILGILLFVVFAVGNVSCSYPRRIDNEQKKSTPKAPSEDETHQKRGRAPH